MLDSNEELNNLQTQITELQRENYLLKQTQTLGISWEHQPDQKVIELTTHNAQLTPTINKNITQNPTQPTHTLITGDNYQALAALIPTHENTIDIIYIDPPYNTGNNDFTYNDNYKNKNDKYKHSTWLSFMKPRLELAHKLLNNTGIIFISIDDSEYANLKLLMDNIFNEKNYNGTIIWQSTPGSNMSNTNIVTTTEYILAYQKTPQTKLQGEPFIRPATMKHKDKHHNTRGYYALDKLDSPRQTSHYSESLNYPIIAPDGTEIWPGGTKEPNTYNWLWSKTKVQWGIENDFIIIKHNNQGNYTVYNKRYELVDNTNTPTVRRQAFKNVIENSYARTSMGTKEIKDLFGTKIFDYPKPIKLIKKLIAHHPNTNAKVLDFFAGSGTTGHATAELNYEDNGTREAILITDTGKHNDTTDNTINIAEDITCPRLQKALTGENWADNKQHPNLNQNLQTYKITLTPKQ